MLSHRCGVGKTQPTTRDSPGSVDGIVMPGNIVVVSALVNKLRFIRRRTRVTFCEHNILSVSSVSIVTEAILPSFRLRPAAGLIFRLNALDQTR